MLYDFTGQQVEEGTMIEKWIPPQFASKAEAEVFTSIEETFETMSTGSFSSDLALNMLIAGFLQQIWS